MSGRVVLSKVRKAIPRKQALQLTGGALARLEQMLQDAPKDTLGYRIGVKTRGCNGLSYTLDYVGPDDVKKFDEKEVHGPSKIPLYIDPRALMYVVGTEMDFHVDSMSQEFTFSNPNIEATCGCGESFNFKT